MSDPLFAPTRFGDFAVPNRVLMAPLTRNRARADGVPAPLAGTYYAQRASAGMIISEATQISPEGKGYFDTPGIHSPEQVAGWRPITEAVHAAGGRILCQLWHVGRVSNVKLQPGGQPPLAPSAVRAEAKTKVSAEGDFEPTSEPRALALAEIPVIVEQYAAGARNAIAAGFDGVEIHGANGYLIDQFLHDDSNRRNDAYGGPATQRIRFLLEVVEAVTAAIGASRVGLRLSPTGLSNGIRDSDVRTLFTTAVAALKPFDLAFLHLVDRMPAAPQATDDDPAVWQAVHDVWGRPEALIRNGEYDGARARAVVAAGGAAAIAFGRPFIANPDLPMRLLKDAPLNPLLDRATWYGGGAHGYTDYPFLSEPALAVVAA